MCIGALRHTSASDRHKHIDPRCDSGCGETHPFAVWGIADLKGPIGKLALHRNR